MLRRESGKAGFGLKGNAEKQEEEPKQSALTPQQATRPEHTPTEIPDTANQQEPRGKE